MSKITGTSTPIVRPTATGQTADTGKVQDSVNPGVPNEPITPPASPYSDKTKANLKAEFAITGDLIRSSLERQLPGMQLSAAPVNTDSILLEENPVSRTSAVLDDINATYNEMAEAIEKEYQKLIREAKNQVPPDVATAAKLQEDLDKKLEGLQKEREKALAEARNLQEDEAAKRAEVQQNISTYGAGALANGLVDSKTSTNERPPKR